MSELSVIEEGEIITCPVCGTTILEEDKASEQPACEHVRFLYSNFDEVCFDYIEPDLEELYEDAQAKDDDDFDIEEFLKNHSADEDLILKKTTHGFACGPMSSTVWIGIRKTA